MTIGLRIQRARPKDTMCGPALCSSHFRFYSQRKISFLPNKAIYPRCQPGLPRAEYPAAICDRHTPQASAASQIPQGCYALLIARTNRARSFHASDPMSLVICRYLHEVVSGERQELISNRTRRTLDGGAGRATRRATIGRRYCGFGLD
jgi:hypothetical protein